MRGDGTLAIHRVNEIKDVYQRDIDIFKKLLCVIAEDVRDNITTMSSVIGKIESTIEDVYTARVYVVFFRAVIFYLDFKDNKKIHGKR